MFPATSLPQEERRVTGVRRLRRRREVRIVFATDKHGRTVRMILVCVHLCKSVADLMVGVDRIELSPRVPKTRMLALHHTPKRKWRN